MQKQIDDPNTLLSLDHDGNLKKWNIHQKKCDFEATIKDAGVEALDDVFSAVVFAKNPKKIITGSRQGVINIWNTNSSRDDDPESKNLNSTNKLHHTINYNVIFGILTIILLHYFCNFSIIFVIINFGDQLQF